ncbi:MAG: glycosyltransferase [Candidatus Kariarchaeaceae archaeon]|jgi:cellulose synthase/poly-beta-1,6-N-acetylglucosamine synthase-like glycosyltransferase
MEGVSILVPVYKNSKHLKDLLDSLVQDPYPIKEIIIIIDEPKAEVMLLPSIYPSVRFIINEERQGKSNALNQAVFTTQYNYLLFLDSDIKVHQKEFIASVAKGIDQYELIDIKKLIIRDSILAKVVNYDYLSSSLVNYFFIKLLHKSPQFNGAAFAIRRTTFNKLGGFHRAICEDLDLAFRAYITEVDFGYIPDIEVYNAVDPSLKHWFKQRRRWALGFGHWITEYIGKLLINVLRNPIAFIIALLIFFPSSPLILMGWLLPDTLFLNLLSLSLIFLSTLQIYLTPSVLMITIFTFFAKSLTLTLISYSLTGVIYYWASRKLGYHFNVLEFTIYFFVYNPLWFLLSLVSTLIAVLHRNGLTIDWKV